MHAEGHIHEVAHEKMQYGVAAQGPGTTGKRVVRREACERLPGRVSILITFNFGGPARARTGHEIKDVRSKTAVTWGRYARR